VAQTHRYNGSTFRVEFTDRKHSQSYRPLDFAACHLTQIHTQAVHRRTSSDFQMRPRGDAQWTAERELSLVVKTADCVPLLMGFAGNNSMDSFCGAVHGGWRSGCRGILKSFFAQTAHRISENFGELHIWIGPHIQKCCFQVGPEVIEDARGTLSRMGVTESDWYRHDDDFGKFKVDLVSLYKTQIEQLSRLKPVYHEDYAVCTSCHVDRYFSYRKEGKTGSLFNVITLEGPC